MTVQTDQRLAFGEPISPELVLVSPELRARVLKALREAGDEADSVVSRAHEFTLSTAIGEPAPQRQALPSLIAQLVAYAAWQTLMGALVGLAATATVALSLVLITFVAH